MPSYIYSKPEKEERNIIKVCQRIGNILVDPAILQGSNSQFQKKTVLKLKKIKESNQ